MSKHKRDLGGEEKKLWRRVVASVKPRRPAAIEPPQPEAPPDKAAPKRKPAAPLPMPTLKRALVVGPPADREGEKRVRRGKLELGATLDLHGHTQDSARAALARFLHAAQARGDSTVIVVTGMGRAGEGVLKRRLPAWLAEPDVRPLISGYAQAHRSHGGAGAFYVFIKRPR